MQTSIRFGFLVYALFLTTMCSAQVQRLRPWQRLSADGLELLTTNTESDARDMLRALQNANSFFHQIGLSQEDSGPAVRVFAFSSKAEYANFQLSSGAFGHYIHARQEDFIVLEDIRPQHREAGIHEFTHVALQRAGLKLPIWVNEGLADVYSSLTPDGDAVIVGSPLPARTRALDRHPWMNLDEIFTVSSEQRLYQHRDLIDIFYGQSWALTHMLLFAPKYASGFPDFLKMVGTGVSSREALAAIYETDSSNLYIDLRRYWQDKQLRPVRLAIRLALPSKPLTESLATIQSSLELAGLLAALPSTATKAEKLLLALLQESPEDRRVQAQLDDLTRRYPMETSGEGDSMARLLDR